MTSGEPAMIGVVTDREERQSQNRRAWTDYGYPQGAAEDIVGSVIETILTDGGTTLWQKYLERKAFPYAADAVVGAVVSQLQMCFVAHDEGEDQDGLGVDWELEDEPEPREIDNWARAHVPLRKPSSADFSPGASGSRGAVPTGNVRRTQTVRTRNSDTRARLGRTGVASRSANEKSETRSQQIFEEYHVDDEEERFREAKTQEEVKRRDAERRKRESEKAAEEERRRVEALHEQMKKNPHTFDSEGRLIWIDPIKVEKLATVQQSVAYAIKKDRLLFGDSTDKLGVSRDLTQSMGTTGGRNNRSMRQRGRRNRGLPDTTHSKAEPEFTDSFSKLQHGQPPILETMQVATGVILDSNGKKKSGPDAGHGGDRHMSRKEYLALAEQEVSGGGYRNGSAEMGRPGTGAGEGDGADGDMDMLGMATLQMNDGLDGSGLLPPIAGAAGVQRGLSGGVPGDRDNVAKAPRAPPKNARRARAFDSIGFMRHPRYHKPELGGPYGYGAAQPPLGATMGHGLVRHGSLKEAYFFPPPIPDLASLVHSRSDVVLSGRKPATPGSGRRQPSSRAMTPRLGAEEELVDTGGKMRAEASPAYRNFRQALFPDMALTSTATFGRR